MPEVVGSFSALQILLATRNRQYGLLNAPVITFHSPAQVVISAAVRPLYASTVASAPVSTCTQNTGFFRRIFQFIKSLPSSVQTKLLRDIADENADERRRAVGHDLAPHRAVAVLERLQSPALLLLLFHHALDTGSQLADRGGQLVELAHIVLQQLNALILPTIFFFEPSAKLFVLCAGNGTVHLHSSSFKAEGRLPVPHYHYSYSRPSSSLYSASVNLPAAKKMSSLSSKPSVWPRSIMRFKVRYSIIFHLLSFVQTQFKQGQSIFVIYDHSICVVLCGRLRLRQRRLIRLDFLRGSRYNLFGYEFVARNRAVIERLIEIMALRERKFISKAFINFYPTGEVCRKGIFSL
nr:MAG TPA: hypothetical protein [Caudoviricetes sp.]